MDARVAESHANIFQPSSGLTVQNGEGYNELRGATPGDGWNMASDDAILDLQSQVQSALLASPVVALRELRVERAEHALRLRGSVASFYHKQLAQEVVRAAVGERCAVENAISVR